MKKITLLLFLLTAYYGYAQPTTDPTAPPARNTEDVISIYGGGNGGNPYTDITGVNYSPNWSQPAPWNAPDPAVDTGSGNLVLFYDELSYQGTDFTANAQNAASMEFLHVDIWTPNAETINVSPINNGTGGTGTTEVQVGITTTAGAWTSIDIPKSSFTGMTWDAVGQFIFVRPGFGSPTPRADVYLDNIYFWKNPADPLKDATLSDLQVAGATINGFGPATLDYTYEVQIGTTTAPQITSATTTNGGASASITQAPGVPGDATIVVTSADASTMQTYTVSFTATLPNDAPNPNTPNGEVLSLYGDTGGFTNIWTPDYAFGAFDSKIDLDSGAGTDEAIKMDFSDAGYGEGTNAPVDISAYNFVNFSYFAPNLPPGANGHEVKFILIGQGEGEKDYILKTDGSGDGMLVFGSWQNLSIDLSHFTALGLTKPNYLQFKLGTTSDLNTTIVYFDNIYFSANAGTLSNKTYAKETFKAYPNPTQERWTLSGSTQIESVRVYDVLGKQVLSLSPKSNEAEIDGSDLKTGIYFAQIETIAGIDNIRLIKQ
ncbi:T9SS type A sorting domain-containing protein [Hyunsoonleella flava]|uniref:T9SS type A sorting domain-containing protein n=1 Tax=Hyunsoonleella flava TaxID=2527939 RepID=A0A4Q9FE27_9FLAO|nr:T9SS type A sorting domain-containing protein [Hyunsoonleella flava]TBN04036.1 T9SS type A sorting domain-containing protein [Hyunsoonleella flava]